MRVILFLGGILLAAMVGGVAATQVTRWYCENCGFYGGSPFGWDDPRPAEYSYEKAVKDPPPSVPGQPAHRPALVREDCTRTQVRP